MPTNISMAAIVASVSKMCFHLLLGFLSNIVVEIVDKLAISASSLNLISLLENAKLAREISDGKNEIPHKFLGRKI